MQASLRYFAARQGEAEVATRGMERRCRLDDFSKIIKLALGKTATVC
jgi:hypothetical protein